ncbi:uncharacterized protein MELLADRAFT_103239 [Melampsora larici-populina 98AG31]|uniref:Uncharacterized protein n=1 Tax=Melampsora larici-populina (strain 98AG31 / pathotype 3-4-7) TaxID=747676 RepID=F4RB01_MELLP|nr:uncharacterized protein MELLADRAFT_103239 [Melampsora larici-populina 98AG31]EGG10687.1 hypothetical protein MELLADRAFT_103239 [Melampsora larici-populina 98AG31]
MAQPTFPMTGKAPLDSLPQGQASMSIQSHRTLSTNVENSHVAPDHSNAERYAPHAFQYPYTPPAYPPVQYDPRYQPYSMTNGFQLPLLFQHRPHLMIYPHPTIRPNSFQIAEDPQDVTQSAEEPSDRDLIQSAEVPIGMGNGSISQAIIPTPIEQANVQTTVLIEPVKQHNEPTASASSLNIPGPSITVGQLPEPAM